MRLEMVKYYDIASTVSDKPDLFNVIPVESVESSKMFKELMEFYRLTKDGDAIPRKSSINIKGLQKHLDNIFLMEIAGSGCPNNCHYFYRVVGTSLREVFGEEMTMKCLEEQSFQNIKGHMKKAFKLVEEKKEPLLLGGAIASIKNNDLGVDSQVNAEILFLPFSNDGNSVDHILGAVSY